MISTVVVKYGKPVLKLKYRTLKGIAICSVFLCVIIFLFALHIFTMAVSIRRGLGTFIDLISNNGGIFPTLLALPALLCILVNVFVIYYIMVAFRGSKNKFLNTMLFTFVIVCLIAICILFIFCICSLSHAYSSREAVHDGIKSAMYNYSKDSLTKMKVDKMQIEYDCCGSMNYTDWYPIPWYDANLLNTGVYPTLRGQMPFSCCSTKSVYSCIHHGVEIPGPVYIYSKDANLSVSTDGCHDTILKRKAKTGWIIVSRIMLLVILEFLVSIGLRFIQTAHFEKKAFDREDRLYTSWLIGCYAGKTKTAVPPPVPPVPLELM